MDLKKQRIEMAVTGLMLGLASYLQYMPITQRREPMCKVCNP